MIDSMMQAGTDAALDDQVARPRTTPPASPAFSLLGLAGALPRGIGGGLSKSIAFGAEIVGAFGQVAGAYDIGPNATPEQKKQAEAARMQLLKPGGGIDYSNEAGDTFRARAKDILPDPHTAHASEQVVAGLADFATRAVGYTVTLGPLAPLVMGGDAGLEESDRLKQQGVDLATRTKAGAVAGVLNAAAVALPMTGATAATRFAKGVAIGEGTIVGQSLAEREILKRAGYDKIAESFDPLDPVALALGVVPGVLGARFGHAAPAKLKPLKTEADVARAAVLSPAEQVRSDAYERSPTNLAELERAIKAEKNPQSRALLETELTKQRTAAREHGVESAMAAEPDFVPAARVSQAVEALDRTRLTPDADLAGRDAHLSAVELAADQMGRGERVSVADVLPKLEPATISQKGDFLSASVEGGQVGGTVRDGALHINFAELTPDRQGEGRGVGMYQVLVDEAHARGLRVFSDSTVEIPAVRVYDSLRRRGYDVERLPGGGEIAPSPEVPHGAFFGAGAKEPAFEVRRSVRGPDVTAAAMDDLRAAREPAAAPARAAPAEHAAAKELLAAIDKGGMPLNPTKLRAVGESLGLEVSKKAAPEQTIQRIRDAVDRAEGVAKPASGPKATPAGEGDGAAPSAVARAASEAEALNPDMLVQLEGMDAPMRVGDLLAKVKEEAANDVRDSKLVEVAAACDLRS